MKKIATEINDLLSKGALDDSDLVYLGYLSECLYSKAVNQYVKNNAALCKSPVAAQPLHGDLFSSDAKNYCIF